MNMNMKKNFLRNFVMESKVQWKWGMKNNVKYSFCAVLAAIVFLSCVSLGERLDRAEAAAKEKDHDSAIIEYTAAIRKMPDAAWYYRRGWQYLLAGRPEKARDDFNKSLEKEPNDFNSKLALSHIGILIAAVKAYDAGLDAVEEQEYDRAIVCFTEAVTLAPDYSAAYDERGASRLEKGMFDEAETDFREALRTASADIQKALPYGNLGIMYEGKGNYEQAADFYKKSLQIYPYLYERKNLTTYNLKGRLAEVEKKMAPKIAAGNPPPAGTDRKKSPQETAKAAQAPQSASTGSSVDLLEDYENIAAGKTDAKYWSARAERGEARAQYQLALHYNDGTGGVRKDMAKAISWYTKSAEGGYSSAQYNLALCYLDGKGVTRDTKKAFEWFLKAAEQDHKQAQYNAGICYLFGEGTPKNSDKAIYWFTKRAEDRHADSQFNLALMYYNGDGVPRDRTRALFWSNQAVRNGHAKAREVRDELIEMGYDLPRNSEQDMLARGYTKAGEGVYRAVLYTPFDDLKAGAIAADDKCIFISKIYVDSNFRNDINTWFMVMDQKYIGNGAGVISGEPGEQKFFTVIFNDRTFIPKIGDTVYIGWRIYDTANVQTSNDVEKVALALVSGGNGFNDILFESVPVALAASYSESEVLEKVRTRIKR
jgi:TPR repeat protein